MDFEAAVLQDGTDRTTPQSVTAGILRDTEVLVRIVATGICHSDIAVRDGLYPVPRPLVLGHEGAGIVERTGRAVTKVAAGDCVALSYLSCGVCPSCAADSPAYCHEFGALNVSGLRGDGSSCLSIEGTPVGGHFFGQSSFAAYSVANERNVVRVRPDAPLELMGPFGCGFQTGAGAILNSLAPSEGQSLIVLGGGGVGMAAIMAGKIIGCDPIVLSEPNAERRALALEIGATHVIDPAEEEDLVAAVRQIVPGGADCIFDTSGHPSVIEAAIDALAPRGQLGLVAQHSIEASARFNLVNTISLGKTIRGIVEGDADPDVFIPQLVDHFMEGRFPIDRLVTYYDFADLNRALDDQAAGKVIKPIVRMTGVAG
jgi:aryl-alcohol dehydrogenase